MVLNTLLPYIICINSWKLFYTSTTWEKETGKYSPAEPFFCCSGDALPMKHWCLHGFLLSQDQLWWPTATAAACSTLWYSVLQHWGRQMRGSHPAPGQVFSASALLAFWQGWWWFICSVMSDSCDPMDCSLAGSSDHRIFQARILKWVAISFLTQELNPRLPNCQ